MLDLVGPALATVADAPLVVLGVTPELVHLPWPDAVIVHACDHSAEMIASVWQAHQRVRSRVLQASWQHLPFPGSSVRAVVGDGSLNVLPLLSDYPDVLG